MFKTPEEADASTRRAIAALLERQAGHELMWTQRDLRALRELGPLLATVLPLEELQEQAFAAIRDWVKNPGRVWPATGREGLREPVFTAAVARAKADLRGLVPRVVDRLREILNLRSELLVAVDPPPGLQRDVLALVPPDFLRQTPFAQLSHFSRYLKAMKLRAGRWRKNPAKDSERAAQLAPYLAAVEKVRGQPGGAAFRWLVEEYRVSLFAQELGTAEPVSAVKLDRALAELRSGGQEKGALAPAVVAAAAPAVKPMVAVPVIAKKPAPLKNLNALDKLFGR